MSMRTFRRLLAVLTFGLFAACDALFTGERVAHFDLVALPEGGFAPVTVALGPQFGTVALNLRAEVPIEPSSMGKWNEYLAVLRFGGASVATAKFRVNYTGTVDAAGALFVAQTVLSYRPEQEGDYTLTISAAKTPEVGLYKPQLELRKNIATPK